MRYTLLILLLLLLVSAHSVAIQPGGELIVVVEGLRNQAGLVNITLFNKPDGFPGDTEKAFSWDTTSVAGDSVTFIFRDLPAGNYAFAVLHDENADGKMNKIFPGIPKEGFAFSNNFRPKVSAPGFRDVAFTLREGSRLMKVKMIYYF